MKKKKQLTYTLEWTERPSTFLGDDKDPNWWTGAVGGAGLFDISRHMWPGTAKPYGLHTPLLYGGRSSRHDTLEAAKAQALVELRAWVKKVADATRDAA